MACPPDRVGSSKRSEPAAAAPPAQPATLPQAASPAAPPAAPALPAAGMQAAKGLLAFLPPATLITGLLFYFGWARTYAQARALGADASVFGYSTRDYLLRSVDSLYLPFMVMTALGMACLVGHQAVAGRLRAVTPDHPDVLLRRVGLLLLGAGLLAVAYGLLYSLGALGRSRLLDITGPLALGVGVLLGAYGGWLRRRARGDLRAGAWGQDPPAPWAAPLAAGLLLCFVALSLFWAVGNFALWRGQDLAAVVASSYRTRPSVVVYSPVRLALEGITEVMLQEPGEGAFAYRYSGMRLLDHASGTYFLMPEDWSSGHRLILLKDSEDIRVELASGAG